MLVLFALWSEDIVIAHMLYVHSLLCRCKAGVDVFHLNEECNILKG